MADFNFAPAKSNIAAQPGMSLGEMMNMATQAQALQQAQQLNPLQLQYWQQNVEQSRQMNPLLLRSQTAATDVAEQTKIPKIAQAGSEARTAEAGAGSAELKFSNEKLNAIANRQSSLANNPLLVNAENDPEFAKANAQKISDLFLNYGRTEASNLKIPKEQADQLIQPYLEVAINQPAGSRRFVIERMLAGMDHAARAQIMQPSGVKTSTGAVDQVVATNIYGSQTPGTTIPGTQAIQTIPPTTPRVAVPGDNSGQPPGTTYLQGPQAAAPVNAPPPAPIVTGLPPAYVPTTPIILPPGETSETAALAKNIQLKANEAARAVQATQFNNNQLIRLADKSFTGVGASTIANLGGGYAALPWTSDATSNLQSLGHYMASETKNLATSSGLSTDAGRGLSEQVSGSTIWTNDSIKSTARINRALSTGVSLFNQGVNNAVETAKGNPFAARDFQNKWSQIATVDAFRLMDAKKNNDVDGMKKIIKEMGGIDSKKFKDVVQQVKFVDNLVGASK